MPTHTVGVFQDLAWAHRGIDALLRHEFEVESLSVIVKSTPEGEALARATLGHPPDRLDVKKLGPTVAGGPLVVILQGSDNGLVTAGISDTFRRAGFQAHDGEIFEALVSRGGLLVGITSDRRAADALATLHAYGGGNAAIGAWSGRV
jgi:hypothetical protein